MILQGLSEGKEESCRGMEEGGKGGDGWKCTALSAADCGQGESIAGLVASWRCRVAERLRYRQAQLEMLFHPSAYDAFLAALYVSPTSCSATRLPAPGKE